MIETAAWLMLLSGATHAVVNGLLKSGPDKLSSRAIIDGTSALLILPGVLLVPLPNGAWGWLAASLAIHFVYLVALVHALEHADMSAAYPVMRGIAPALAAVGAVAFLGDSISLSAALGIGLVCGGIGAITLFRPPTRRATGWALLTGVAIAVYTVVDAAGVRAAPNALSFIVWVFVFTGGLATAFALWRGRAFVPYARKHWRPAAVAGVLSIVTYGAALLAYDLGEVPRLAALRETSILFAIVISGVFLKEKIGVVRSLAAGFIFLGSLVLLVSP